MRNLIFGLLILVGTVSHAQTYIKGKNLVEVPAVTATAGATTTLTNASQTNQMFTGTLTQIVVLPSATTLAKGNRYFITDRSTGALTVNASGGSLLQTMAPGTELELILTNNNTAAGTWDKSYLGGSLYLPNATYAVGSNAAGTASVNLISVNSSDNIIFGDATSGSAQKSNVIVGQGGNTQVTLNSHGAGNGVWIQSDVLNLDDGDSAPTVLKFWDFNNGKFTGLVAPASLTGNITLTLPDGDGSANQFMKTNGSGTLSWTSTLTGSISAKQIIETVVAGGTCSTSYNVDPTAGTMINLTLNGACAIGVTNLVAGHSFTIKLTQSSTTAPTFTAAYKWASGTAPTWSTSATKYDMIACASLDGTTLDCSGIIDVR